MGQGVHLSDHCGAKRIAVLTAHHRGTIDGRMGVSTALGRRNINEMRQYVDMPKCTLAIAIWAMRRELRTYRVAPGAFGFRRRFPVRMVGRRDALRGPQREGRSKGGRRRGTHKRLLFIAEPLVMHDHVLEDRFEAFFGDNAGVRRFGCTVEKGNAFQHQRCFKCNGSGHVFKDSTDKQRCYNVCNIEYLHVNLSKC